MINRLKNGMLWIYLIIMLGFFPLFYKKQYVNMGDGKYKIFLFSSLICLGFVICLCIFQYVINTTQNPTNVFAATKNTLTLLDMFVIGYFIAVLISFFLSAFKKEALFGAPGWSMGFIAQLIFFCGYFLISRNYDFNKIVIYVLLVSTAIVFLLGILHRFYIDPLSMYIGLSETQKLQFLSTIGQSSWYSSFVCTVFPVGLYIFYSTTDKKTRIWSGIYSILGYMTLVTQNSDSAYLSIIAILFVLFYLSFDGYQERKRFWETLLIMLFSFKVIGLLQFLFKNHTIALDFLSMKMSQGYLTTILFILVVLYYILAYRNKIVLEKQIACKRYPFYIILTVFLIGIIGVIVFIVLNSNGYLYKKFGYYNTNNYLLFQDAWGNNRGFTWRFTVFSYKNLSFLQKIFGVGPDCYAPYNYSIPEYSGILKEFWNGLSITNAHNEYMTTLFNYGIVGLFTKLGMLIMAVYFFIKNRKENSLPVAFALCIVSYMAHNIFCYEQVCCTPFIYIFIGLGSGLLHRKEKISF